ncbi:hypothetical protein [Texcoconibacillus texcoconensis]|uniref:Uncharacterized protein n=1 Tax=Texcoconibacillus texcoconensis TaxID=1095777 RepID=A0A840QNB9_9BACI|nr:hypothetical protein [Texcoconibacillus texcoconensis]MBB5172875.1 hypothetical protein [Texcoconibacillus texcoconensis]
MLQTLLEQSEIQLRTLMKQWEISGNLHSKQDMVERLYKHLKDDDEWKKQWRAMHAGERMLALSISLDPRPSLNKFETKSLLPRSKQPEHAQTVERLLSLGLLFKQTHSDFFWMPVFIKKRLKRELRHSAYPWTIVSPNRSSVKMDAISDVITWIDQLEEDPLPLTKSYKIHKRDLKRTLSRFQHPEELPDEKWRFGYGRHFDAYPDRFSLLYDFCYRNKWIEEREGYLQVTKYAKQIDEWSASTFMKNLLKTYINIYRHAIPCLPFIVRWLQEITQPMEAIDKEWVKKELQLFVDPFYFDGKSAVVEKRILNMLEACNFLTTFHEDDDQYVYPTSWL